MQLITTFKIKTLHPFTENEGVEGCELAFIATKCVYEADKEVRKIIQSHTYIHTYIYQA